MNRHVIPSSNPNKAVGAFSVDLQSYKPTLANEVELSGRDYVLWGDNNLFPNYLYDTYMNCPTLQSIINGSIDYTVGDRINIGSFSLGKTSASEYRNSVGDTIASIAKKCTTDRWIFGGCAVQVSWNDFGNIADVYYVDIKKCRVSIDRKSIYYLEEWKPGNNRKALKYPVFNPETRKEDGTQIYFYRGEKARGVYPVCGYYAALVSAETQIEIQKFHYNSIINSFMCDGILNFNNAGDATEDVKNEVEAAVQKKFSGAGNASRLMISWNEDTEKATTFTRLADSQFDKKYTALAESTRENIFISLRALPVLFGLTIQTGFNTQEYEEAFSLYNRTAIKPAQNEIAGVFNKIFEVEQAVTFDPFTLDETRRKEETEQIDEASNVGEIPAEILGDLTTNERRGLIGYPELESSEGDQSILADRLGVGGTQALVSILQDQELTDENKRGLMSVLFGLTQEQIDEIL